MAWQRVASRFAKVCPHAPSRRRGRGKHFVKNGFAMVSFCSSIARSLSFNTVAVEDGRRTLENTILCKCIILTSRIAAFWLSIYGLFKGVNSLPWLLVVASSCSRFHWPGFEDETATWMLTFTCWNCPHALYREKYGPCDIDIYRSCNWIPLYVSNATSVLTREEFHFVQYK